MAALLPAFAVVVVDRISKLHIQHSVTVFDSISVVPGFLRIIHTENPGAAFGVLAEAHPLLRSTVLVGISLVVLCFVGSALLNSAGALSATSTRVALSLIFGGAIGNLYDRIFYGTVTDFIEVYYGHWSFPAFNVADSAITVGAILLVIGLLRPQRRRLEEHAP